MCEETCADPEWEMLADLVSYLKPHANDPLKCYVWGFDSDAVAMTFGFVFSGATPFARTCELKKQLQLAALANPGQKNALAKYFIKEWGGIRGISDAKIADIVRQFDPLSQQPRPTAFSFPFQNISSWSKWLSLICPDWAVIYDARVAYTLNAINYRSGGKSRVLPSPAGRNIKMNLLDAATLALSARLARTQPHNITLTDHLISHENVYSAYLNLVQSAHRQLWPEGTPVYYTEMLLFSIADNIVFDDLIDDLRRRERTISPSTSTHA